MRDKVIEIQNDIQDLENEISRLQQMYKSYTSCFIKLLERLIELQQDRLRQYVMAGD